MITNNKLLNSVGKKINIGLFFAHKSKSVWENVVDIFSYILHNWRDKAYLWLVYNYSDISLKALPYHIYNIVNMINGLLDISIYNKL